MLTEIAMGKTLDEARQITNKDVAKALEGLPKNKLHCSNLGADALQLALRDYEDRRSGKPRKTPTERSEPHEHGEGGKCYCPYCDVEIKDGISFCEACQSDLEEEH
jgi:nitrogen fixation NifU-like protein